MMRSLWMVLGVFCAATLLSLALGIGLLWYRGQLTPTAVNQIHAILTGEEEELPDDAEEEKTPAQVSLQELAEARTIRVFELGIREKEVATLKQLVVDQANALAAERADFEKKKAAFEQELAQRNADITSEARERARGVLLALPQKDAVESLMKLSLEENVSLLREMPEKAIAKILKEFFKGDPPQVERGRQVFEALSKAFPDRDILEEAAEQIGQGRAPDLK